MISKMVKLLLLLAMAAGVVSSGGSGEFGGMVKRDIRLCGRMLVDALSLMCNGEYYDPNDDMGRVGKRSSSDLQQALLDPLPGWIAVAMSSRGNVQHKRDRPSGIVDECCKKSCSPSTLLSYCRRMD